MALWMLSARMRSPGPSRARTRSDVLASSGQAAGQLGEQQQAAGHRYSQEWLHSGYLPVGPDSYRLSAVRPAGAGELPPAAQGGFGSYIRDEAPGVAAELQPRPPWLPLLQAAALAAAGGGGAGSRALPLAAYSIAAAAQSAADAAALPPSGKILSSSSSPPMVHTPGRSTRPSEAPPLQPASGPLMQSGAGLNTQVPAGLLQPDGTPYLTTAQAIALAGVKPAGEGFPAEPEAAEQEAGAEQPPEGQQLWHMQQQTPVVGFRALLQVCSNPWIVLEFACLGLLQLVAAATAIMLPQALPETLPTWQVGGCQRAGTNCPSGTTFRSSPKPGFNPPGGQPVAESGAAAAAAAHPRPQVAMLFLTQAAGAFVCPILIDWAMSSPSLPATITHTAQLLFSLGRAAAVPLLLYLSSYPPVAYVLMFFFGGLHSGSEGLTYLHIAEELSGEVRRSWGLALSPTVACVPNTCLCNTLKGEAKPLLPWEGVANQVAPAAPRRWPAPRP